MKIRSNSEQTENTKSAERQKKASFPKEKVENTDLYKFVLNKVMTTQGWYVKQNFAAPLIEYNMRNIFTQNVVEKLFPGPFLKNLN